MFKIQIEQYSGPLDILLQLIEKDDLNISEVSLSSVTEEYLRYVERLDPAQTQQIADFLVVAAKLVYLKSKTLLPAQELEEEVENLEDQLRVYRQYVAVAAQLEKRFGESQVFFFRSAPPLTGEFVSPKGLNADIVGRVMTQVVSFHQKRRAQAVHKKLEPTISLEESLLRIRSALKSGKRIPLHMLLGKRASAAEYIVHFLAALQLVKDRKVRISQQSHFGDIHLVQVVSNK